MKQKNMKLKKGQIYSILFTPKCPSEGKAFSGTAKYTGTKKTLPNGTKVYEFQGTHTLGFFPKSAITAG